MGRKNLLFSSIFPLQDFCYNEFMSKAYISLFLVIFLNSKLNAQEKVGDLISDPIISLRCKNLLRDRSQKILVQQKLSAMILRNEKLTTSLKPNQQVLKHKLELNKTQLSNNLRLTKIRIKSMEEDIIRKGCPGITL